LLAAINNSGVAVGTAQSSARISRAVTFGNAGGGYVLNEVPAFDYTVPTTGVDINNEGVITGAYTDSSGNVSTYLLTPTP
jgi:hypothetical protein